MKDLEDFKNWLPSLWNGFMNPEQIINDLLEFQLTDESKAELLRMGNEGSLIMTHHTLGRWIRNHYKMWDPNNPHIKGGHPDDISFSIITDVYLHLKNGR